MPLQLGPGVLGHPFAEYNPPLFGEASRPGFGTIQALDFALIFSDLDVMYSTAEYISPQNTNP